VGGIYSSTRQASRRLVVDQAETLYIYPEQYEGQEGHPLICCTAAVVEIIDHHLAATLTLASPMKDRAPVRSVRTPTRAERLMVVMVAPSYAR
jgi:hypothetical protein